MKEGTVALVIQYDNTNPKLVEALSDDHEITLLESALGKGEEDPLSVVRDVREVQKKEDDDFGNYVEELLEHPFLQPEIQKHGVEWFRSKIRIEQFQKTEQEATEVIAGYAYKVFMDDPKRTDFYLAGPKAKVRIRVFVLPEDRSQTRSNQNVA